MGKKSPAPAKEQAPAEKERRTESETFKVQLARKF